jgi:hypothetical protein
MCADSLVSLLPVVVEQISNILDQRRIRPLENHNDERGQDDGEMETPDRLVPTDWVTLGVLSSIIVGTFLVWVVFGNEVIKPWATVLGFILGGLLSVIGYVMQSSSISPTDVSAVEFEHSEKQI